MKCPHCGHSWHVTRLHKNTYQERPGKLPHYSSAYEAYRAWWIRAQRKPTTAPMKKDHGTGLKPAIEIVVGQNVSDKETSA